MLCLRKIRPASEIISEGSETVEFNGEFLWFFHGDMANNIREVNTAIAVKN